VDPSSFLSPRPVRNTTNRQVYLPVRIEIVAQPQRSLNNNLLVTWMISEWVGYASGLDMRVGYLGTYF
jgi:hypothetical protein